MNNSYDDQHYSGVNPETLAYQETREFILTIWAALRPCREMTGKDFGRETNPWITWVKPKKWNPDCGMRVYQPGRLFGKREFAQVVLNIIGDDFEISVWRKRHEGVVIFSTRDQGPILSPSARLQAAVSQMMAITKDIDRWSRNLTLDKDFPGEWQGASWQEILKDYIAHRYLRRVWTGGSWRGLFKEIVILALVRDKDSILHRQSEWAKKHTSANPRAGLAAAITQCLGIILIAAAGASILIAQGIYHLKYEYFWSEVQEAFFVSWNAISDPTEYSDRWGEFELERWLWQGLFGFPLYLFVFLLVPIGMICAGTYALFVTIRNVVALVRFLARK